VEDQRTAAGRALAALRPIERRTCVVCGAEREAYPQMRYCSNRCRQRAKYLRMKERERQASPQ
jgi:hypothetical protein